MRDKKMNELAKISKEYKELIQEIGGKFKQSQIKAASKVNEEMLEFYFWLGSEIYSLKAVSGGTNALYGHWYRVLLRLYYKCYRNVKSN